MFQPPKWLTAWISFLSMIGLPTTATWGLLGTCWRAAEGETLVGTRLLLGSIAVLVPGIGTLLWYSLRRDQKLKAYKDLTPKPVKVSSSGEKILKFLATRDPQPVRLSAVAQHMGLPSATFRHHWNELFYRYRLVNLERTPDGEDAYVLSRNGLAYAERNKLVSALAGKS